MLEVILVTLLSVIVDRHAVCPDVRDGSSQYKIPRVAYACDVVNYLIAWTQNHRETNLPVDCGVIVNITAHGVLLVYELNWSYSEFSMRDSMRLVD